MSERAERWWRENAPEGASITASTYAMQGYDAALAEMREPSPCGVEGHTKADWERGAVHYRDGVQEDYELCRACEREAKIRADGYRLGLREAVKHEYAGIVRRARGAPELAKCSCGCKLPLDRQQSPMQAWREHVESLPMPEGDNA